MDPQGTGSIPHQTFLEVLVNKGGDSPISPQLAQKYLNNPTFNKNKGFFDYATFCECCFETSKALDAAALELQNKKIKEQEINTRTYRVNKNNNQTPIKTNRLMRGAFYFEGDSIIGHQYTLRVQQRSKFKIDVSVSADCGGVNVDSRVFVFKLSGDANSRVGESSSSVFVARSGLKMPGQEGPSW